MLVSLKGQRVKKDFYQDEKKTKALKPRHSSDA